MKIVDYSLGLTSKPTDPRKEYSAYKGRSGGLEKAFRSPIERKPTDILDVIKYFKSPYQEDISSPYDLFKPSSKLTRLVNKYMLLPSGNEVDAFNITRKFYGEPEILVHDIKDLESIVSHELEDFLTDWACLIETADESTFITRDQEFIPDVCSILIDRLQLNPGNPGPVLTILVEELLQFISIKLRQRSWGQIKIKRFEIFLEVNEGAFAIPKIESLDKDRWI